MVQKSISHTHRTTENLDDVIRRPFDISNEKKNVLIRLNLCVEFAKILELK